MRLRGLSIKDSICIKVHWEATTSRIASYVAKHDDKSACKPGSPVAPIFEFGKQRLHQGATETRPTDGVFHLAKEPYALPSNTSDLSHLSWIRRLAAEGCRSAALNSGAIAT